MAGWRRTGGDSSWDASQRQRPGYGQHSRLSNQDATWPFERGDAGSAETDEEHAHLRQQKRLHEQRARSERGGAWPFEQGSAGAATTDSEQPRQRQARSWNSTGGRDSYGGCGDDRGGHVGSGSGGTYGPRHDGNGGSTWSDSNGGGWRGYSSWTGGNGGRGSWTSSEDYKDSWKTSGGYGNDARGGAVWGSSSGGQRTRSRSRNRGCASTAGKADEDTSGDWHCSKCGIRNFARRAECFKCHAPRTDDSGSKGNGKGGDFGGGTARRGGGVGSDRKGEGGGSRDLIRGAPSRSRSGSSSASSSRSQARAARNRGPGLWDSTDKVKETPRPPPPPALRKRKPMELAVGARVDIVGLVGAAQYNGSSGRVLDLPNEKGRWSVQVDYQAEVKTLALLPDNIRVKPSCGWEVVCAGLSNLATEQDIHKVFSAFGHILTSKVTRDLNGESKGVALIEMGTKEAAERALEAMNQDGLVRGRPVTVQWSTMVKQEMGLLKSREEGEADAEEAPRGPRRSFQEDQQGTATGSRAPTPLKVGSKVVVDGLKGAPQYNGLTVTVLGFREDGRCEVGLMFDGESKTLGLKTDNLFPLASASSASNSQANATANEHGNGDEPSADCEGRRSRRSAWAKENDGGTVYNNASGGDTAGSAPPTAGSSGNGVTPNFSAQAAACSTTLPTDEALSKMSAKELRQLLATHQVDAAGCIEKADFLAAARKLVVAAS